MLDALFANGLVDAPGSEESRSQGGAGDRRQSGETAGADPAAGLVDHTLGVFGSVYEQVPEPGARQGGTPSNGVGVQKAREIIQPGASHPEVLAGSGRHDQTRFRCHPWPQC